MGEHGKVRPEHPFEHGRVALVTAAACAAAAGLQRRATDARRILKRVCGLDVAVDLVKPLGAIDDVLEKDAGLGGVHKVTEGHGTVRIDLAEKRAMGLAEPWGLSTWHLFFSRKSRNGRSARPA